MDRDGGVSPHRETDGSNDSDDDRGTGGDLDRRRRAVLKFGVAATAAAGLGAATGTAGAAGGVSLMDDPSPADQAVGGGSRYDDYVRLRDSDYNVWTKAMLLDALEDAGSGDVVHVAQDAAIDLTGESDLPIDDGVTLASGRGLDGKPGGVIYTDDYPRSLFKVYGDDVRVTGLRIRGPRTDHFVPSDYDRYASGGIWLLGEDAVVDNCQLFGWTHAAVSVGSRDSTNAAHVHHCSLHNNAMDGYGYGVNLFNGHSLIEWNYFDMNRHSIDGFGYDTNGYEARYNLVGPDTVSHAFDMHGLNQNVSGGSNVAGGRVHVHHNTFQFTRDVLDRGQEAVTIRGIPDDVALVEKNRFEHAERPDDDDVRENGQAYRQYNTGSDDWTNFEAAANHFGPHLACSGVGHPRPRTERPAWAVDPDWEQEARSGVRVRYENGFDQGLRITDVAIEPESSTVAKLADGSWDEGRWASEVHVEADVRNGTTDVGGGVTLPGSVDMDADGHSSSPDTEPILSGRSTAVFFLRDFLDDGDEPVDMVGERLTVTLDVVLDDGSDCVDEFDVVPESV